MTIGVLLMTYGSPASLETDDVRAYLTRVRGGRTPDVDLVDEFQRRYTLIGGSPLIPITERLAAATERALDAGPGERFVVRAAMRFSDPGIDSAVRDLAAAGAERVVGLALSPQYSPLLMDGYATALREAASAAGVQHHMIGAWHLDPAFVEVMARRLVEGLDRFLADVRDRVPVLMTAHSLPKRVVDREPGYVDQLRATAEAIARVAGLAPERWHFAYQSAGHTPEEWLKPDMLDVLPDLAAAGHRHVLLAPVQFLADHLETLYDIDVGGLEQATEAGIEGFVRVPAPNDAPDFAAALASIVREHATTEPGPPGASQQVGPAGPLPAGGKGEEWVESEADASRPRTPGPQPASSGGKRLTSAGRA